LTYYTRIQILSLHPTQRMQRKLSYFVTSYFLTRYRHSYAV